MSTKGRAENCVNYGVSKWITENEKFFLPPVCNKMMHNTQLKVFFVGGPNVRADYHLEEGEELFYMRKGDMCLKVQEGGKFVDVHIKEGEVFLLPGKIPHSPQRQADTVGLVIERERLGTERDGLRYFVANSSESLFERWFYCDDLGSQLGPVIKEFFQSEQHKTGRPLPTDQPKPYWHPDEERRLQRPFSLKNWLKEKSGELKTSGSVRMFSTERYESDILVFGGKAIKGLEVKEDTEKLLWTLKQGCNIEVTTTSGEKTTYNLSEDEMLLIPASSTFDYIPSSQDSACMSVTMNPKNKDRIKTKD